MKPAMRPASLPRSCSALALVGLLLLPMTASSQTTPLEMSVDAPVKLMTLDPGHFHAGLVQKEMYPGVSPIVHVYAPLGPDLLAHLSRIAAFNSRETNP